jgi:hypothetical protein
LKKEFVIMQISAMRDGSPSVVLTLLEERLLQFENETTYDLPSHTSITALSTKTAT